MVGMITDKEALVRKAEVAVDYSCGGLARSYSWGRKFLAGANIVARDGQGNTIRLYVWGGKTGYLITVNGKEVAQG